MLAVAAIGLGTVFALAAAEVAARAYGHRPRVALVRPELSMHAPDPVRGWRAAPGQYRFGPYAPDGTPALITIGPDGARETGGGPAGGRAEVVLVGCSFTMGWAVSDDETWAWRLQEQRPDVKVVNRGVGGYGTLQSLQLLEELLGRKGAPRPTWVLYGFIDHSLRNVAATIWLRMLAVGTGPPAATPSASLSADGRLVRHPPEAYPSLPLHQYLATMALLETTLIPHPVVRGPGQPAKITQLLIREMADLSRRERVGFSMVLLSVPDPVKKYYTRYAHQQGIDLIDCNRNPLPADQIVRGEVHPNAIAHRLWGDCIAAALSDPTRLPAR